MKNMHPFADGFGSVLNMFPSTPDIKISTPSDLMNKSWDRAGASLRKSIDQYHMESHNDQGKENKRANR